MKQRNKLVLVFFLVMICLMGFAAEAVAAQDGCRESKTRPRQEDCQRQRPCDDTKLPHVRVQVGDTKGFRVTSPPECVASKKICWESENECIATVKGDGLKFWVTGRSVGSVMITATTRDGRFQMQVVADIVDCEEKPGCGCQPAPACERAEKPVRTQDACRCSQNEEGYGWGLAE